MSYSCCSRNVSSQSLGGCLSYPVLFCGSSTPSNLVYNANLFSPGACQLGSSLYRGYQENCYKPSSCQNACVVSKPCQTACYRPRTPTVFSPCQITYAVSPSFGSRSSCSLSYGSRSCYSQGCVSSGSRPLGYGIQVFPGSSSCYPTYFPSRSCQYSCFRPSYASGFCRTTC
ncbi:PREDICTED: keratin-associated protein 13-2-like [Chrysochloris asiatica]|uniref:Keratin-associated protein n=1 Tax=Chrysochloris asiatica TaxID=185453 RepID=A0A9B0TCP5_CHRAS|nr:PREDICTED: keratin-associated protein 13-2-like [Chrysochloris asiatica]